MSPAPATVRIRVVCHWCGALYTRDIEPEYAKIVEDYGICDACYNQQEDARDMEVD